MANGKPRKDKPSGWEDTKILNALLREEIERQLLRSRAIRERERKARDRVLAAHAAAVGKIKPETERRVFDARVRLAWGARYW